MSKDNSFSNEIERYDATIEVCDELRNGDADKKDKAMQSLSRLKEFHPINPNEPILQTKLLDEIIIDQELGSINKLCLNNKNALQQILSKKREIINLTKKIEEAESDIFFEELHKTAYTESLKTPNPYHDKLQKSLLTIDRKVTFLNSRLNDFKNTYEEYVNNCATLTQTITKNDNSIKNHILNLENKFSSLFTPTDLLFGDYDADELPDFTTLPSLDDYLFANPKGASCPLVIKMA